MSRNNNLWRSGESEEFVKVVFDVMDDSVSRSGFGEISLLAFC